MWMWTLNWNEIRADLVVGSCPMTPADIKRLQAKARVTALLSLQHQDCLDHFDIDYPRHVQQGQQLRLTMARCPMRDFDDEDQRRCLPDAVRALKTLLESGHRVYVHCTAGINRSPLVALAYLNFVENQPHSEAFALIRRQRPQAAPSWEAFAGCRQDLLKPHQTLIRERAADLHRRGVYPDLASAISEAEQQAIRGALGVTTQPHPLDTPLSG
jgi:atypical dual specificity phosphatase